LYDKKNKICTFIKIIINDSSITKTKKGGAMKNLITKKIFIITCLVLFCTYSFAQKNAPKKHDKVLDGKVYTIELTVQGGKKTPKPIADEISFKMDKFKSKAMAEESEFAASPYTVTIDSTATPMGISFEAETKNPDDEMLRWVGTITDQNIEGTATLSKKGKTKKEYAFTGAMKEKKKK
jgi:hypothetical protein